VLYEMLTGSVPFTGDTPLEIAMKHLSTTPEPPSERRPDVPHELDSIVLRALAKNPDDRYPSAETMDADLARAARGHAVDPETEEAATQVLRGVGAVTTISSAPTEVVRRPAGGGSPPSAYGPPTGFYEYDEPVRRRSIWPWLLAVAVVAAAIAGGWYVYTKIQDQLAANKPVAVPFVEGIKEELAVRNIQDAGLTPKVVRHPDDKVPETIVVSQDPGAGTRTDKGNPVTIVVSTGLPQVEVPDVRGDQATDAVASITQRGLVANVVHVNSDKETGTVTAQDPGPGKRVDKGTKVRINVSQGPKPIAIPPVIGVPYEQAAAELQGAGFAVARQDVDSNEPKGTVVQQTPGANSLAGKGSTVTLSVSKGPTESTVPDVSSFSRADAIATLRSSGFKAVVETSEVQDPLLDGVVLFQNPGAGTSARPGSTVTITVGHYTQPTTTAATEPTTTTLPPDGGNDQGNGTGDQGNTPPIP
jgi:eukaryotic-like serine/threonine-protein kinase